MRPENSTYQINTTTSPNKEYHMIQNQSLNIAYAADTDTDVGAVTSSNDDSVWVFRITLLPNENNTGYITVTTDATDRAGNPIGTYVDDAIFQIDNTLPTFSFTDPDSGSYVNHKLMHHDIQYFYPIYLISFVWDLGLLIFLYII